MPTIYDLKPRFQRLLQPLSARLHRCGITANVITLTAAISSVLYGGWMLVQSTRQTAFLLLPLLLLVRMGLNALDGMIAREYQQQTPLGAILNETGDVVSDAALYLPFALLPGVHSAAIVLVVFLSVLTEFVGVLGQVTGSGRRYDGPLGKSDRAFLFGTLGLLIGLHVPVQPYLDPIFMVTAILLGWTVLSRVRHALRTTP
jgi:CDP-diacylglycerol--glycerol-3-phosphate 3-phosphatidyltransferase